MCFVLAYVGIQNQYDWHCPQMLTITHDNIYSSSCIKFNGNKGPCKVRNETETKHDETKQNLLTEKRNETEYVNWETKRNETRSFNELKKQIIPRCPRPFKLYVRV